MAGNSAPIFSRVGSISNNNGTGMNQLVTAAANDYTGAGANNSLVFTADATNGSFVQKLRFLPGGSNVASVARVFINNGSTPTSASNNTYIGAVSLPATTASATSAEGYVEFPLNVALDPGFRIYVGLGTAVSAGWVCFPVAGKY